MNLQFQLIHTGPGRSRFFIPLCLALVFCFTLAPRAKASFVGAYAPGQFILTNTNADGSFLTPDGGLSIVITGGNTGSDTPGTTDLVVAAAGPGTVAFQYSYSALDFPGFDYAGYLLGGAFSQLATFDGQSGPVTFAVSSGELFGFRVGTKDNTGEPGILTISNFSAPSGAGSVPEPGTATLLLIGSAAVIMSRRWLNRTRRETGERA